MDVISGDVLDDLGDRDIEVAASIRLGTCPHCSCPHLFLLDCDGEAFAEVVLDAEILREMAAVFKSLLADARLAEGNGNDREDH
jgi:hypothetical protein